MRMHLSKDAKAMKKVSRPCRSRFPSSLPPSPIHSFTLLFSCLSFHQLITINYGSHIHLIQTLSYSTLLRKHSLLIITSALNFFSMEYKSASTISDKVVWLKRSDRNKLEVWVVKISVEEVEVGGCGQSVAGDAFWSLVPLLVGGDFLWDCVLELL